MQRYGRLRDRTVMLLGIGGSTVVSVAWFASNLWDNHWRPARLSIWKRLAVQVVLREFTSRFSGDGNDSGARSQGILKLPYPAL